MINKIKIIKIAEGVFKHAVGLNFQESFYTTTFVKMSIDKGTVSINSGTFNRDYNLSDISLYELGSSTPLVITDMDDFIIKLFELGYPLINFRSTKGLTNAQLRESSLLISAESLPLPGGASTATKQDIGNASLEAIENKLPVIKEEKLPVLSANITNKFREAFESFSPGVKWNQILKSGDIIGIDGNTAAASYLVISKCPFTSGESRIETIPKWIMPFEFAIGLGLSQRTNGQEFSIELVSDEVPLPVLIDLPIETIQQTGVTLTVTTTDTHNLSIGMRIGIRDCVDSRLNYAGIVVNSVVSPTQFTVVAGPMGNIQNTTAGPYNSGFVYFRSALGYATNGTSMIFENTNSTNASFYVRSESGDVLPSGVLNGSHAILVGSTTLNQAVNNAGSYAFQPQTEFRLTQFIDGIQWSDVGVDSAEPSINRLKRTQVVPDIDCAYRVRIRAVNQGAFTRPIAQVVSAAKTGTTTVRVITDVPHGLTTSDYVNILGVRDQTNFPNLTAATAVISSVDANTFTIIWGGAATASTTGGYISRVNAGINQQGHTTAAVQSISRTNNQLIVIGNVNWASLLIGDYVQVIGIRDTTNSLIGVDGAYRVFSISTTKLVLEPLPDATTLQDIPTTNCGGGILKRTDIRISYVRVLNFERQRVELLPRPNGDQSSAAPVLVQNTVAVRGNVVLDAGGNNIGNVALQGPIIKQDGTSGTLTASATTIPIIPTFGVSYQINIPVTAVSGTNPTLDVGIEESDDFGTNWFKVYDFPRITAVGMYRSPKLPLIGSRIRYVQTVGGTTPSFTRVLNRIQINDTVVPIRQLIDRTIVLTTINSSTPSLNVQNCSNIQLAVNVGVITSKAPEIQLQFSEDNGVSWYGVGPPLIAVASTTVVLRHNTINGQLVRATVSTAGVGVTAGYVLIKGY